MKLLALVVLCLFVAHFVRQRITKNKKPSVTDRRAYHRTIGKHLLDLEQGLYENPDNFSHESGTLVAVSPKLQLAELKINTSFRDKIPWCMPPTFGDVEMKGAFPSVETCRLQVICNLLKKNVNVFSSEFNLHKDQFMENPEKIAYGGKYGRIVVNREDGEHTKNFAQTRKILETSADYVRTQAFNGIANRYFMATAFTVLFPGARIRPHFGPTNFKYRIHLCIDIDGVGGIVTAHGTRYWKRGQIFVLDDSYLHAGFYDGTRPRVILMVDIAKHQLSSSHVELMKDDHEIT